MYDTTCNSQTNYQIELDDDSDEYSENLIDEENDTEICFDQTRLNFMKSSRPPLCNLPENFSQLNDDFKKLIESHQEELFSKEYYQEQIYFILGLTKGKKQRQIAKLFGIHPATVCPHSNRMKNLKKKVGAPM